MNRSLSDEQILRSAATDVEARLRERLENSGSALIDVCIDLCAQKNDEIKRLEAKLAEQEAERKQRDADDALAAKSVEEIIDKYEADIKRLEAERTKLREALKQAIECVGEFVDVHGNEWHDGTPLNDMYESWKAALALVGRG